MKKKYNIQIQLFGNMTESLPAAAAQIKAEAFTVSHTGYWLGSSDDYCLSDSDKLNLGIDFKPGSNFTVQDKTLYRFPKLDLPRQKVELLKEKYNCKVIRDSTKADIHIVSDQLFDNLFEHQWHTASRSSDFFDMLKVCKERGYLSDEALARCRDILSHVGTDAMVRIDLPYNYGSNNCPDSDMRDALSVLIQEIGEKKEYMSKSRDIILPTKNFDDYERIINSKATIVYDTDVTGIIDNELAILENTELENILKMVKANDKENRTLALEMLANCNIDKSFDVVSHCFYWHYDWLKDTTNWNTVNVKALRKRLKKYQGGANNTMIYAYNNYINCLIEDKKLTNFALDNTRSKLYDKVLGNIGGDNASVFSISLASVKLKDELLDNLIKEESDEQEIRHSENDHRDNFTI